MGHCVSVKVLKECSTLFAISKSSYSVDSASIGCQLRDLLVHNRNVQGHKEWPLSSATVNS